MLAVLVELHCYKLLFVLLAVGEYTLPGVTKDLVLHSLPLALVSVPVLSPLVLLLGSLRSLHGERQLQKMVVLAASLLIVETAVLVVPVAKVVELVLALGSFHLVVRLMVEMLHLVVSIGSLPCFGLDL